MYNYIQKKKNPINELTVGFLPSFVNVPIIQEEHSDCVVCVSEGETVHEGQIIAKPVNSYSSLKANIHSPIPGLVTKITECVSPYGKKSTSVQIKLKGSFKYSGKNLEECDLSRESPSKIIKKLSEHGVINTFSFKNPHSLAENASFINESANRRLLVRLFDEDASSQIDSILFNRFSDKIRFSIAILSKLIEAEEIVIAYNKEDEKLLNKQKDKDAFLLTKVTYLPISVNSKLSGTGRSLIYKYKKTTKTSENIKSIASSFLCLDSSTLIASYDALVFNKPVETVNLFVSGDALKSSAMIKVCVGTTFRFIAEQCGFYSDKLKKIIVNGYNGYVVKDLDEPITSYVKSIFFASKKETNTRFLSMCKNCFRSKTVSPECGVTRDKVYNHIIDTVREKDNNLEKEELLKKCDICNDSFKSRLPLCKVETSEKKDETDTPFFLNKETNISITPRPFISNKKTMSYTGLFILLSLLPQLCMLFFTKSYSSLTIIAVTVLASLISEIMSFIQKKEIKNTIVTSVLQGLFIGFFIPSTFPVVSVFFITLAILIAIKYCAGNFANSWINPVVATVITAWFVGSIFFPSYQINQEQLLSKNPSLFLFDNGIVPFTSFDSLLTLRLNESAFSFFGISVPNGYVSLFWDTQSIIPAFRFNFLTIITSIILISSYTTEGFISFIYIAMYSVLVRFISPFFTGGIPFQGDVLLALLSSGTLFAAFFIIPWYGTSPCTVLGKIIYGVIGGFSAFLFAGCGTSPIGIVASVLIMNLCSPMIQLLEKRTIESKLKDLLRKEND